MRILYERCAAVDVGKDVIAVAVRLPGDGPDGRQTVKRTFKTFYGVLREAARWLTSLGVTHVAMEATGIYSMPVYHALIEHGDFTQVLVCNAGHVKNVPGRKTDLADAEWLVHLLECGLLARQLHPAGGHQGRPGRHPVPDQGRAVADLGGAAARQRAAGRRDQDRLGGLLHRHQVRPGDDRGADRRGTPRRGAGRPGQGQDAVQDRGPVHGAGGPLRGPSRPDVPPAPGPHRPPRGDDREAGRAGRGDDGALSRPAGPADDDPGHRPAGRRRGHLRDRRRRPGVLPRRRAPGLLGRAVPGQPRIGRETPLRPAPPRQHRTCSRSWSSPPGRRSATRATSRPSTTGTS